VVPTRGPARLPRRSALTRIAERVGARVRDQLALAWLTEGSPAMLPIPGTSSVPIRRECRHGRIELSAATYDDISASYDLSGVVE